MHRLRQVSAGGFQICYTDRELEEIKHKGGIGMVNLSKLPAFVQNKYEKAHITESEQFFNPQKRRFDQAYNTILLDQTLKYEKPEPLQTVKVAQGDLDIMSNKSSMKSIFSGCSPRSVSRDAVPYRVKNISEIAGG